MAKKTTLVLFLVLCLGFVTNVATAYAAGADFGTTFYLYRSDGPLYFDVKGTCSAGVEASVGYPSSDVFVGRKNSKSSLNGTWRVWPNELKPNTKYAALIDCFSSRNSGLRKVYEFSYTGNKLNARLVSSGPIR